MINNVILECPRCLTLFAASTASAKRVGERLWSFTCRCGRSLDLDMEYMDRVELWAQPHVANRIEKIEGYRVNVEGLTYTPPR